MTILIDFDDCVCENHFIPVINKYLKTNYKEDDFHTVFMEKELFKDKDERNKFYDFYISVDSYQDVKLRQHAYDVIKRLLKRDDVYFITSACHYERTKEMGRQFVDKWNYIFDTLPYFPPQNIVFVAKKHIFKADVIIDDRVENLKGDYKYKLLFTCYHNKNITQKELEERGIIRVQDWLDVEKFIAGIEKAQ